MAKHAIIKVKEVNLNEKTSRFTNKDYKELYIKDTLGEVYKGILDNTITLPEINDTLDIIYQDVSDHHNIISIKETEVKQMTKTTKSTNDKYFKIKGTLFYAHIKEPDTKGKYPSNKYKAELSVSKTTKKALEDLGVEVKNKGDDKGDYIVMKSSFRPTVIDPEGETLTEIPLIGNGSKATVTVSLYENKAAQGGKNCLGFSTVQLESLVHYEAKLLTDE